MRTFVVPLDGSELAESAVWLARRVALNTSGGLCLVRVVPPEEVEAGVEYLSKLADTVEGVPVSIEVVAMDPGQTVASGISQAVEAAGPDALLCLTLRGHGALGAAVLGSTAEDLLRDYDQPILVASRQHPRG